MPDSQPTRFHLLVAKGPHVGRRIAVPPGGASLGRSSANDIPIDDPALSRRHCRFEFHEDGSLWVLDFGSANQTLVNDRPVTETCLMPGDRVLVGDTLLQVVEAEPAGAPADTPADAGGDTPRPHSIDLGFGKAEGPADSKRLSLRPVVWTIAAAAVLLLGWAFFFRDDPGEAAGRARPAPAPRNPRFVSLRYEKVEASTNNIFRYEMTLSPDFTLAVKIDDLAENRHVREEKVVASNLVYALARELESSGFFQLDELYAGIPRDGMWNTWDLQVVVDRRARRCSVRNRVEPRLFQDIRERLETFGKNELGIWAIQFSRERLVELADDAFRLARKKQDERDVAYENLATAIRAYREAEFYLDTVEPKPEFYPEIVAGLRESIEELDRRHAEQRFLADRAINLSNWKEAAAELRVLLAMIPDREDERHREAERKLLDVENRLRWRK